ncbi:hypothetical protein GCM10027569_46570 [Flindersiella endophytica]
MGPGGRGPREPGNQSIDRRALVDRHAVIRTTADPLEPLSVGNGEFAFTVDVTGLQSLEAFHSEGMPLHTQAQWAWHSAPNPEGYSLEDSYADATTADGRSVRYLTTGDPNQSGRHEQAAAWLRENPHRIDLGRIGFIRADGSRLDAGGLTGVQQRLDLWHGRIDSRFVLSGTPVRVTTACHPADSLLAVRISSELLASKALAVEIRFPYASGDWVECCDWNSPERHFTGVRPASDQRTDLRRMLDADVHHVALAWSPGAALDQVGPHAFILHTRGSGELELVARFGPGPAESELPSAGATFEAAARHWADFWSTGGALELGGSDPRAAELERRVVLSQYLTAVNCAGSTPPAETGLVTNSWRGKFHLEMHWWHAAHFALWGRAPLLERSLPWYERILPRARDYATRQGYRGARWPKQIGPEGRESPSDVGAFLIWQQPHPIYYAELLRRAGSDAGSGERYAPLVFETAEFMASYAVFGGRRFSLGPPLTSAQEKAFRKRAKSLNPAFELAYWAWGLRTAQCWRERLGLERVPHWDDVARRLAPLPVRDGRYVELEHPQTRPEGHPTMVGALGFVPDIGVVSHDVMRETLRYVLSSWELGDTWGWDYPLLAMTAARLDEPALAVDALLLESPKNGYLANGHNFQKLPQLPLYLPGNGGLLFATAMMAAGWDGAPDRHAPGFPAGWDVAFEGLTPAP